MPAGSSSNNTVCNMVELNAVDSCDKNYKSRIRKEDNIELELLKDINDENAVISHNCKENVIFGSHDGSVYCVTNPGKLVWKIDAESPVYSTPFSGLVIIKGKCNDNPNTYCLKEAKIVERIPDEPNIMIDQMFDQNSIVESDERGIVIGDTCFNPNALRMVKIPQSFDHSEFIRVEYAENLVNGPSNVNDQNHENHTKEITEGGKYTADDNENHDIDVKSEAIKENRSIDVKNDAFENENQNIGIKIEDADNENHNIDVKSEAINEYQSMDVKSDAVDNENGNMDVKTEDVDKEYQTIGVKSKEVYNEYQKTDVEADIVENAHLNSFLTNEDIDRKHQNCDKKTDYVDNKHQNSDIKTEYVDNKHQICDIKTEYIDNKHQISDIKTEDVDHEYLNVDVKSESVDQNIGVKQKAVDQNRGVRQKDVDQNISAKSNTADACNVSNSGMDNTQSVAIVTFATTTGILYVVGAEDGQVLYQTQMEGEVFSSPILYRNSLVVGCRDDNVYCFDIDIS